MQRAAELAQLPADQVRSDEIARVDHLLELMEQILAPNEQLVLLNVLQPVFDSQPNSSPDKTHCEYQLKALKSTGRTAQSLALGRQLAIDNPHDARRQQLYARALVDARDYAAAKAWLDGVLVADAQWTASDEVSLRNVIAEMYRKQEQYAELVAYLAGWVATNPEFGTAYPQYLSALIKNDQLEQAAQVMEQWHAEGLQPGRLSQPAALRLSVAVELAIGEGFDLRFNRLDPPWPALLAKAVLHFAQQDTLPRCVNQIMSDQGFQETAEYRRVQGEIVQLLSQRSATLPVGHLPHLVDWVAGSASAKDLWPAISAGLLDAGRPKVGRKQDTGWVRHWPACCSLWAMKRAAWRSCVCSWNKVRHDTARTMRTRSSKRCCRDPGPPKRRMRRSGCWPSWRKPMPARTPWWCKRWPCSDSPMRWCDCVFIP